MKCLILCTACANGARVRIGDGSKYPGEHVKYVKGIAKKNPYMQTGVSICDYCEAPLPAGTECQAMTIWADHGGQPYEPWESVFIEINEGENVPN